jgi:hypothetical protein
VSSFAWETLLDLLSACIAFELEEVGDGDMLERPASVVLFGWSRHRDALWKVRR